jgi:hypothetical protein
MKVVFRDLTNNTRIYLILIHAVYLVLGLSDGLINPKNAASVTERG